MENNNKYYYNIEALMDAEDSYRREKRRRKRKMTRIYSWVFLALFCVLFATLGALTFVHFYDKIAGTKDVEVNAPVPETSVEKNVVSASSTVTQQEITDVINSLVEAEPELVVPEPEVHVPTEQELIDDAIEQFVKSMSINDKVAGIFIVAPEQITGVSKVTKAGTGTKDALLRYAVGGIIYSEQNITSEKQFKEMLANTEEYARYPLFLAIDEEPGNTVLAHKLKLSGTMTALKIGETLDGEMAYGQSLRIADYLKEYGINLTIGVVADVMDNDDTKVLGDRSFGGDPNVVGSMVSRSIAAYEEQGINTGVKFFPGQATGGQDTTYGLSVTERTKEAFDANDRVTFMAAAEAGADMLVVSHVSAPNITGDNTQCSRSKYILSELIRKDMELSDIIIITDALNKAAITAYYDSSEAVVDSIKAGADMVLLPENFEEAYSAVFSAVSRGVISEERINDSLKRVYKVKFRGMTPEEILNKISNTK